MKVKDFLKLARSSGLNRGMENQKQDQSSFHPKKKIVFCDSYEKVAKFALEMALSASAARENGDWELALTFEGTETTIFAMPFFPVCDMAGVN